MPSNETAKTPPTGKAVLEPAPRSVLRRHAGGFIALAGLAAGIAAWVWLDRQPTPTLFDYPHGVLAVSWSTFAIGLFADIRDLGFDDVIDGLWAIIKGIGTVVGMILEVLGAIASIFSWN